MNEKPGCLSGIFKLTILNWVFDFMQQRFGFGRGLSCGGCGCGFILLIIFIALACSIITGTDWTKLIQSLPLPLI